MTQASNSWMRRQEGLGVWEHRGKVAITGVGHSTLDRRWDGKNLATSLGAYSVIAARKAIEDSGVNPDDIDGVITSSESLGDPWGPRPYFDAPYDSEDGLTGVTAEWLTKQLGLKNVKYFNSNAPQIGAMMGLASQAVGDGVATNCLVLYPTGNLEGRYHHALPENLAPTAPGGRQWLAPWGNQGGAMMGTAMTYTEYCYKYQGGKHDWLAPLAVNQRRNGLRTPWGFYATHEPYQITEDDYLSSRWIMAPLRLFDCDRPVNGAACYLFSAADKAKDLKQKPVYVLNHAQNGGGSRGMMVTLSEIERASKSIATKMYEGSGLRAEDLDVFNPYDGYLAFTQNFLEGFGWHGVKLGESADFYKGDITTEGPHPFASGGGNNGNGRTRTAIFTDSIEQLRGTAGERQIHLKAETAMAGCNTPNGCGWIALSTVL